jgi:hypothetical protein
MAGEAPRRSRDTRGGRPSESREKTRARHGVKLHAPRWCPERGGKSDLAEPSVEHGDWNQDRADLELGGTV